MTQSFPEKKDYEIKSLVRKFYHNFFDLIFESIKLLSISKNEIIARMKMGDMAVLEEYKNQGKSVILALAHYGNWEMGALAYTIGNYPSMVAVYKAQTNKFFDELMVKIRTRFGGEVVEMYETMNKIRNTIHNQMAIALLADQNPTGKNVYWYKFLDRETPVFTSVEVLAKRFNFPVVYLRVVRKNRGFYEMNCELLTDEPQKTEKFAITQKYIHLVEQDITNQPDNWLWTHNRWKRKK